MRNSGMGSGAAASQLAGRSGGYGCRKSGLNRLLAFCTLRPQLSSVLEIQKSPPVFSPHLFH
jgi:hypothetical protein